MPVYLPTAVLGNDRTLVTFGQAGEIMGWFYPSKDHAQNIYQCMPCVYVGYPGQGRLSWAWGDEWHKHQAYAGDSNVLETTLTNHELGLQLLMTDVLPDEGATLLRRFAVRNLRESATRCGVYLFGDWNMGGIRTGNSLIYSRADNILLQGHREAAVAIGGSALEQWQCGKAGQEWANNARYALESGHLWCSDLEIGDVNWAFGFSAELGPGAVIERDAILAMSRTGQTATEAFHTATQKKSDEHRRDRETADAAWLSPGVKALQEAGGEHLPAELSAAYRRSLLCLPLLCGEEGVAVAAPEFDPEFLSCGGYGYQWPRDGGEYVSGLIDAGYPQFAQKFFDWCARHQDPSGLWHQRYFLNGEPGPNWCLPPDMLQIDQVGAVLWAYGKWLDTRQPAGPRLLDDLQHQSKEQAMQQLEGGTKLSGQQVGHLEESSLAKLRAGSNGNASTTHQEMIRKAADYLASRLTDKGVHGNAFDTWETFVGSFTYSNAALYAAFVTAHRVLDDEKYAEAARRVKAGVLKHFVREENGEPYLTRGFNSCGDADAVVDSASLGAIEPFGLLDLTNNDDLRLAEGTLNAMRRKLEVDWEGGRAIRRFEGDAYVGGVPACVNTLWMARCSLHVAARLRDLGRESDANELTGRAQLYLSTVLRRATPTGLLPELMQGPTGQRYWAAPHGWAMASFVSGVLMLARQLQQQPV